MKPVDAAELNEALAGANHFRDQAIIWLFWDSGIRNSELCGLDVGSVEFDDEGGALVRLPLIEGMGFKTGPRAVYVVESVPALRAWLQLHPMGDDPEAPLFTSIAQGRHQQGDRLWPWGVYWMLKNCCRRAGIRMLNPHLFRHTRATRAAKAGWSEAMMRAYFGWAPGSDMPAHYVHLAQQDMEDQVRRDAGIDGLGRRLRPDEKECVFCREFIKAAAKKCKHCGEFVAMRDRQVCRRDDRDRFRPNR